MLAHHAPAGAVQRVAVNTVITVQSKQHPNLDAAATTTASQPGVLGHTVHIRATGSTSQNTTCMLIGLVACKNTCSAVLKLCTCKWHAARHAPWQAQPLDPAWHRDAHGTLRSDPLVKNKAGVRREVQHLQGQEGWHPSCMHGCCQLHHKDSVTFQRTLTGVKSALAAAAPS